MLRYCAVHDGVGGVYQAAIAPSVALLKPTVAPPLIHRAAAQHWLRTHFSDKRVLLFPVGACWSRHGIWESMPVGIEDRCRGNPAYEAHLRARLVRRLGPLNVSKTSSLPPGAASFFRQWLRRHPLPAMQGQLAWSALDIPRERVCVALHHRSELHGFAVAARMWDTHAGSYELEALVHNRGVSPVLGAWLVQRLAVELSQPLALGLSPLTGPVPAWLRWGGHLGEPLYPFASLASFKEKQAAANERRVRFLVYPAVAGPGANACAIRDLLCVFAGGSISRFALRSLVRRLALSREPATT